MRLSLPTEGVWASPKRGGKASNPTQGPLGLGLAGGSRFSNSGGSHTGMGE